MPREQYAIDHGALHGVEACSVRYLVIGLGGFLGANARYVVAVWAVERLGLGFPYGTLIVNVSGSFLLGFFLVLTTDRVTLHPHWRLFFAIGFLGAYTTFSTFSFESIAMLQNRASLLALVNLMGSVVLGLIAVMFGMACARLV
jgi:CrcB protein